MSAERVPGLTAQQYLEIERRAETRSEYFDGQMFAMSGASYRHNAIVLNCAVQLRFKLAATTCRPATSDLRVRTGTEGFYTYPDLVVFCDKPQFADDVLDTLLNPVLITEVLSDSTEAKDRGFKFHQYGMIESLREYVLVSQHEPRVEVFRRTGSNAEWAFAMYSGKEATARFSSIDCDIPLADIFAE